MADTTYNNQTVYRKQGADELVVADGGAVTVESGGKIDLESGAEFYVVDSMILASRLKALLESTYTVTRHSITGTASNSKLSGVSTISPAYGIHLIKGSDGCSYANFNLPTAVSGATLIINMTSYAGSMGWILASTGGGNTGVSVTGIDGLPISALRFSDGVVTTFVKLVCQTDATWEIVEIADSMTAELSS